MFWAKPPSDIEVLNDLNGEVINFYKTVKNQFKALQNRIKATLHSRQQYKDALVIYKNPHLFSEVDRAWAFWVSTNQSFSANIGAGWKYDRKKNQVPKAIFHKRARFENHYAERLELVSLDCRDALEMIQKRDSKESFFYIDPPYFNADQGHYKGYTEADFQYLLDILVNIQGKFLLSSYPSELLTHYQQKYEWHQRSYDTTIRLKAYHKPKTEVLTANYPLEV